jgi:hypothetical protein
MLIGGPRMLWPAACDVIFAISLASIHWPVPQSSISSVARQWLEQISIDTLGNANGQIEKRRQVYHDYVEQLIMLAQKGSTMKAKAKLLLSDMALALNNQKVPAIQQLD